MTNAIAEGGARPRPRHVYRSLVAAPLGAALVLVLASSTHGHGGSARLLLEPARINPGGTVVVEGDDLSSDDQITLVIAGGGQRVEVGDVVSDGQGHLTQAFIVPGDLAIGPYEVEAVGSAGDTIAAPLVISGVAASSAAPDVGGDGEPLLVPLPSGWHSSLSSPGPGVPNPADPPVADGLPVGVIAGIVAGVLLVGLVLVNLAAGRRRQSP